MNLRQKLALGLCVFYLVSVIGLAISLHFCGDKLSDVGLAKTAKCGMCSSEKKDVKGDHCCDDTSLEVKITDSHQTGAKVTLPQDFSLALFLSPILSQYFASLLPHLYSKIADKAPPLSARQALYVLHCVYRN
jgi:hypothetical protein